MVGEELLAQEPGLVRMARVGTGQHGYTGGPVRPVLAVARVADNVPVHLGAPLTHELEALRILGQYGNAPLVEQRSIV